jgi:hypothetical protein
MGKRRHKATRPRRASSADIRFTLVLLALGAVVLALVSVLVEQLRAADRTGALISGGVLVALLAVGGYSIVQRRRG